MGWRNLDAKIDRFDQQIASAIRVWNAGGRPDWDSIWQLERDIQSDFDIPIRYPTKQDHDRAWERFSAARDRLGASRRLGRQMSGPRRRRRSPRKNPQPRGEYERMPRGLGNAAGRRRLSNEWSGGMDGQRGMHSQVHQLALAAAAFAAGSVFGVSLLVLLVSGFAIGAAAWVGLLVILIGLIVLVLWLAM